jgi:hypothetical protein
MAPSNSKSSGHDFNHEWQEAFKNIEWVAAPKSGQDGSITNAIRHIKNALVVIGSVNDADLDDLRVTDSAQMWNWFDELRDTDQQELLAGGLKDLFGPR